MTIRTLRRSFVVAALVLIVSFLFAASSPLRADAKADVSVSQQLVTAPWSWPLEARVDVVRPFDPPSRPWLAGHRGVDLDAPIGAKVLAPASGTVQVAGTVVDRPLVSLTVGTLRATFEPVIPLVTVGEQVERGQVIGIVVEGHAPGTLHWGAKLSRTHYLDPLRLLVGDVVLKPWDGS